MLHVAVCAYVPSLTHSSLQQKQGLPLLNQVISWTTLGQWMSANILGCLCAKHLKSPPVEGIICMRYVQLSSIDQILESYSNHFLPDYFLFC